MRRGTDTRLSTMGQTVAWNRVRSCPAGVYRGYRVRSGLGHWPTGNETVTSNNTLERTVDHRGRIVLAMDCELADVQWWSRPAAQLGR